MFESKAIATMADADTSAGQTEISNHLDWGDLNMWGVSQATTV